MSNISGSATPPPPAASVLTPPLMSRSRGELLRRPLILGGLGVAAVVALHFRDPHTEGSWGGCPFLFLTGQPCPGCGGLRAVNNLTNGDVAAAISSNAMAVLIVAVLGVAWVIWLVRRAQGRDVPLMVVTWPWAVAIAIASFAFMVFRWTPAGAWFAP